MIRCVDINLNPRVLKILKAPRLFRIGRILKYLENMEYAGVVRVVRLYVMFLLIGHWVGCFYPLVNPDPSFANLPFIDMYVQSLYVGVILLLKNNLTTTDDTLILFSMCVIFSAACLNAIIFGNMTVIIENMDKTDQAFQERMDLINEYMRYLDFPSNLVEDIHNFYEFLWLRNRSLLYEVSMYDEMSDNMRKKVNMFQHVEILRRTRIFEQVSTAFLEEMLIRFKPKMLLPKVMLFAEGDLGSELYFIGKGSVDAFIGGSWVRRLEEGDIFGEIGPLLNSKRRTATCMTAGYCDLYYLDEVDMEYLFANFSEDMEKIQLVAKKRFKENHDLFSSDSIKQFSIDYNGDKCLDIWRTLEPTRKRAIEAIKNKSTSSEQKNASEAQEQVQPGAPAPPPGMSKPKELTFDTLPEEIKECNRIMYEELKAVLSTVRDTYSGNQHLLKGILEHKVKKRVDQLERKISTLETFFANFENVEFL